MINSEGVGRQYLSRQAVSYLSSSRKRVRDTGMDAIELSVNFVQAASKATKIIKAPSGIGGPVDVVLVSKEAKPQRLRWKSVLA